MRIPFVSSEFSEWEPYEEAFYAAMALDDISLIHNPGDHCERLVSGIIEADDRESALLALAGVSDCKWVVNAP